jgi:hypothetical protein
MNPPKKLNVHQQAGEQQRALNEQQSQTPAAQEFATVEDLLRHDAAQTPVPAAVGQRLAESVSQLPVRPARAWWRRLLGG